MRNEDFQATLEAILEKLETLEEQNDEILEKLVNISLDGNGYTTLDDIS